MAAGEPQAVAAAAAAFRGRGARLARFAGCARSQLRPDARLRARAARSFPRPRASSRPRGDPRAWSRVPVPSQETLYRSHWTISDSEPNDIQTALGRVARECKSDKTGFSRLRTAPPYYKGTPVPLCASASETSLLQRARCRRARIARVISQVESHYSYTNTHKTLTHTSTPD